MKKILRLVCATAGLIVLFASPTVADDKFDSERYFRQSIVGSWEVTVTVRQHDEDCANATPLGGTSPNPFPALNTYHKGGTLSETGSRSPPSMRSPGHGIWERTGRDTFASRMRFQGFDVNGLLFTNMDIRSDITLARDGMTFSAVSRFAFSFVDGPTLPFCATMEGVRITL